MTPEERWQDAINDRLDRLDTPDPPDLERPIPCWGCGGEGWVSSNDERPFVECPTCKGHGRVAA